MALDGRSGTSMRPVLSRITSSPATSLTVDGHSRRRASGYAGGSPRRRNHDRPPPSGPPSQPPGLAQRPEPHGVSPSQPASKRRAWDSNPRGPSRALAVFKTGPVPPASSPLAVTSRVCAAQTTGGPPLSPPSSRLLPP